MDLTLTTDYSGFVGNMLQDLGGYVQAWVLYLAVLLLFLRR